VEGNLIYLFAAAAVIWVAIFAYLLSISGRISAMRRELEALEEEWPGRTAEPGSRPRSEEASGNRR
jgi:CcmD family protein